MTRILSADLGNSRLSLALFAAPADAPAERLETVELEREALSAELSAALAALGPADRALVSSVAHPEGARELEAALTEALGRPPERPEPGLEVRCRQPEAVGRDRLYAALGAVRALGVPLVVLDCGTALTVDAVRPGTDGSPPAFLGGAIAPGPRLLARALGDGTAQLFEVQPAPGGPALGRDTAEALAAGVVHGLRGAAAHLARQVAREADLATVAWVVTGGARRLLLEPEPILDDPVEVADLVHHGLLAAGGLRPPEVLRCA